MSTLEDEDVLRRVSFVKLACAIGFGLAAGVFGLTGVLVIAYFLAFSNAASFFYVSKVELLRANLFFF